MPRSHSALAVAAPAEATAGVHVVSTWPALVRVVAAGGHVRLGADIDNPDFERLVLGTTPVVLDLHGFHLDVTRPTDERAGIEVGPSAALRVVDRAVGGQGRLLAFGGDGAAGIGGDAGEGAGSVVVDGGTVVAIGATGIGGGAGGAAGDVTVTGGVVTASGGSDDPAGPAGAGIGGGAAVDGHDPGVTGTLTVTGGTVFGGSNAGAAGIGGGTGASGVRVRIGSRGLVAAQSGRPGASAVGGGTGGSDFGALSNAGTLTIQDSVLTVPTGATVSNSGTINGDSGSFHLGGGGIVRNSGDILAVPEGNGAGPAGTNPLVLNHSFQVTFDHQDGSAPFAPIPLLAASIARSGWHIDPPTPTPGSTFVGWFTAPVGGTRVKDTTDLPSLFGRGPVSVTLYAHYKPTL